MATTTARKKKVKSRKSKKGTRTKGSGRRMIYPFNELQIGGEMTIAYKSKIKEMRKDQRVAIASNLTHHSKRFNKKFRTQMLEDGIKVTRVL